MGNKIIHSIFLILIVFGIAGCDKGGIFDTTGEITTEMREVGFINRLFVYDNINVVLTDSIDSGFIMVSAGKNIIKNITTDIGDNLLIVRNKNKYNWVRDLDPEITVYVSGKNIGYMLFDAVSTLSTESPLTSDYIIIDVSKNGFINLDINCNTFSLNIVSGFTDVKLNGICDNLLVFHGGYAPVDCRSLQARKVKITEASIQNSFIFATDTLEPAITSYGNIYYFGNPKVINYSNTGKGRLIEQQ